jgi:hypothetical protein
MHSAELSGARPRFAERIEGLAVVVEDLHVIKLRIAHVDVPVIVHCETTTVFGIWNTELFKKTP